MFWWLKGLLVVLVGAVVIWDIYRRCKQQKGQTMARTFTYALQGAPEPEPTQPVNVFFALNQTENGIELVAADSAGLPPLKLLNIYRDGQFALVESDVSQFETFGLAWDDAGYGKGTIQI